MKKFTILAIVALLTMSLSVTAQNRDSRRGFSAKERTEQITKELNLSAEESAKVEALFQKNDEERAKQFESMRANRENVQSDREARRKEMQDLREKNIAENDAQLEAIIGKEKIEQWKEIRAKRQESNRDVNRSGRRAPSYNR